MDLSAPRFATKRKFLPMSPTHSPAARLTPVPSAPGRAPAPAITAHALVSACLAAAAQGDCEGYFDLGTAFSTDAQGIGYDLVEAHKWFNLAALAGHADAARARADVAEDMTAREIAEAQRRAREWLRTTSRRAA